MGWTRHDDRRPIVAKMAALSDAAYRLDDELIAWCAREGTNGRISAKLMPTISPRSARRKVVEELATMGRLHRAGDEHCGHERCPQPGPDGYSVHDYLQYNPGAEKVVAERAATAARVAKHRFNRHGGNGVTSHVTGPVSDSVTDGVSNADSNAAGNGVSTSTRGRARVDPDPNLSPSPPLGSPLAQLGLTDREIDLTEKAIRRAMPEVRSMPAVIKTLVGNGDIQRFIDDARAAIAGERPPVSWPKHDWAPDVYGVACVECPLPEEHPCHGSAALSATQSDELGGVVSEEGSSDSEPSATISAGRTRGAA